MSGLPDRPAALHTQPVCGVRVAMLASADLQTALHCVVCCSLRDALSGPLNALRKAAREVGTAAADAKLGVVVDDFVERFR